MSLLGKQVFANPTTPLWGGGGGGYPSNATFTQVSWTPLGSPIASSQIRSDDLDSEGSCLNIQNGSGSLGPLVASRYYAKGATSRVIYQADGIDFQDSGETSYFLATVNSGSNGWDLSNISTINGSNYPPGGGGSYPTDASFNSLNVLQGGTLNVGSSINQGTSLRFFKDVSGTSASLFGMAYSGGNLSLCLRRLPDFRADQLRLGDLRSYGDGGVFSSGNSISLGNAGTGSLGIRSVDATGAVLGTYITFAPASNAMDLSNVTSINARPVPVTATTFTQSNLSTRISNTPTPLLGQTFTAPADGKLFVQAIGNFQSTVSTGTTVGFNLDVNGTPLTNTIVNASSGPNILEVITPTMTQFPVTGGTVYDISAIAFCTVTNDWNAYSAQLFLSFTTA
jgi:hypothetical protein